MPSPISRAARLAPKRASAFAAVARVVAGLHPPVDDRRSRRDHEERGETGQIRAKGHGRDRVRCSAASNSWRASTQRERFARGPIRVQRPCRTSTRCARRCARELRRARCAASAATRRSRVRFERFFTELRDPLVALYGDDARFPARVGRGCCDAIAATAARAARRAARARPRARDHAGLAAARAGGRLRGLRRPLRRDAGAASASGCPTCASSASPTCT